MFRPLSILVATAVLALAPPALAGEVEVTTVDGTRLRGSVLSLAGGATPRLVLSLADGATREVPLTEVIELAVFGTAGGEGGDLEAVLRSGEIVRGLLRDTTGSTIRLESALAGAISLDLDHVRWLRFLEPETRHPPLDEPLPADADVVFARDGVTRQPEGTVNGFADRVVEIESPMLQKKFTVHLDQVGAIAFAGPGPEPLPPGLVATIEGRDGSLVRGRLGGYAAGTLALESASGLSLRVALDRVARITFAGGAFDDLSALVPLRIREIPHVYDPIVVRQPPWKPGVVQNYFVDAAYPGDKPIRLGGVTHRRGLGLHSWVEATWTLGKKYRLFTATVGIDDHVKDLPGDVEERGSVIFRVLVDGKEAGRWPKEGFATAGAAPLDVRVPLEGAETFAIVVDYAGNPGPPEYADTHIRDRAVVASPRLLRAK